MVTAVAVVMATMGSSQAMKAAWVEDMLALIPPLAFLIAVRRARKQPDAPTIPTASTARSASAT